MAKKQFGKIITFAAVAGAAAAAISYVLKYKSFHKELDEDFRDFEDDFEEFGDANENNGTTTRSYVSLNSERPTEKKEDISAPAKDEQESCCESIEDVEEAAGLPDPAVSETVSEAAAQTPSDSTTIVEDTTV